MSVEKPNTTHAHFFQRQNTRNFSVSIPRDTLGEKLLYISDDMQGGRNCQQKSRSTV
jgi:hypothetical protein